MTLTIIQDTITSSLKLDLDKKTAQRIIQGPSKSQGFFEEVSWKLVVGDSSEKRRSQTYHCYLRKKGWFTEIIYILSLADPDKPTLTIKSNPTEVDISQYATKGTVNDARIYKNPILMLDRIYVNLFSENEKTNIKNLDLEISDVEVAVPLVTALTKDGVLRILRTVYGTRITLEDGVSNVAESLGIRYIKHPNSEGNLSLAIYSGRHHHFTVTFYDKIEQMLSVNRKIEIADRPVWEKYVRMDIRMTRSFLRKYLGPNHNLATWVKTAQNGEFKKLLNRILNSTLRLSDVLIPECDFESLDYNIKNLSKDFHRLWRKSTTLTTEMIDDSGAAKKYRALCEEFKVRPTTGGDLLAVACRSSLFQNITREEFLGDKKKLIELLNKNSNSHSIDDVKIQLSKDLNLLCK